MKKPQGIWTSFFAKSKFLEDEEHSAGARISLEKNKKGIPFEITCGVYGLFFHTAFASTYEEADTKYQEMKSDISAAITSDQDGEEIHDWIQRFVDKY